MKKNHRQIRNNSIATMKGGNQQIDTELSLASETLSCYCKLLTNYFYYSTMHDKVVLQTIITSTLYLTPQSSSECMHFNAMDFNAMDFNVMDFNACTPHIVMMWLTLCQQSMHHEVTNRAWNEKGRRTEWRTGERTEPNNPMVPRATVTFSFSFRPFFVCQTKY